jgi:hypothetical protein
MNWIVFLIAFLTSINIFISIYMTYQTANLAVNKCNCAVMNGYWFIIFIYFGFSVIFLIYTLFVMFGLTQGLGFVYMMIGYLIATLGFVIGSSFYTKYLISKKCTCVGDEYKLILKIITIVRFIMTIITIIAFLLWGLYFLYKKNFVNKR